VGLLGHVIELRAGSDYESLVLQRICRPLKMDSTCIALPPQLKARLALGHRTSGEISGSMDFQTLLGNGALRSTANDMLNFLGANCGLTRCDLGPAMERTRVVHIEHQALGWSEGDPGTFWKNGGTFGYRCDAGFQPAKHRGVIVLSNSFGSDDEIDEIAYVLTLAEWHSDAKAVKVDPQIYDLYAGDYRLPDASIITVRRQLDRLLTQRKGHITGELLPKSESTFFGRISGREVTFVRGPDGKVTELALSTTDKNKPIIATRLSKTTQP
jgi:CubicO group peptidase (beta-lactamase class C family)